MGFSIFWYMKSSQQSFLEYIHHHPKKILVPFSHYLPSPTTPSTLRAKSFQLCLTLCDPWTVARQTPLSMEFSRQEYWSGLPCLPLGDLPDPGNEPKSLNISCIGR